MTTLSHRVEEQTYPLWQVVKAEPDPYDAKEIRVKVNKPLGKDSRIKVKGNAIASGSSRMIMPYYWIGNKKYKITDVNTATCQHLMRVKAKVRVYELEEKHKEEIRSQKRKKEKEAKRNG